MVWAGTNDGQVQVTRDAGARWTNVTANIPGLPPWGTVSNIEPSRFDAGTAYVTVDLHQVNNRDPFVYKTTDYGRTWRSIAGDIPKSVHSYAHCVREDPVEEGLLYLGTENALYFSLDDGEHWLPLQSGLPHAPVHWLTIQEHFNDLVVATYGRGFWILDDITPLRQLTPRSAERRRRICSTPRPAYRFRAITDPMMMPDDPTEGRNPPDGARDQLPVEDRAAKGCRRQGERRRGEDRRSATRRDAWCGRWRSARTRRLASTACGGTCACDPTEGHQAADAARSTRRSSRSAPTARASFRPPRRCRVLVPPGTYTVKLVVDGEDVRSRSRSSSAKIRTRRVARPTSRRRPRS